MSASGGVRGLVETVPVIPVPFRPIKIRTKVRFSKSFRNIPAIRTNISGVPQSDETEDPLVEDFEKIFQNRLLLPEILKVVNQAMPKPQDGLATAGNPDEYKQAAESVKREERNQIFVSDLSLTYVPDLTEEAIQQIENASKQRSSLKIEKSTKGADMMGPGMMGPGMMGPGMMGPGMGGPGMPGMGGPGMPGMGGPGNAGYGWPGNGRFRKDFPPYK